MAASESENKEMIAFRRYFNQEMTPGEQQRFEKRLLSDPLFSEAYEGYALMKTDHVAFPDDLSQMLSERVRVSRRVFPLWRYSVAAAVLFGLIGFGYWNFYYLYQSLTPISDKSKPFQKDTTLANHFRNTRNDTAGIYESPNGQSALSGELIGKIEDSALKPPRSFPSSEKGDILAHLSQVETQIIVPKEEIAVEISSDSLAGRTPAPAIAVERIDSTIAANDPIVDKNKDALLPKWSGNTRITIRGTSSFHNNKLDSSSRIVKGRIVDKDGLAIPGALTFQASGNMAVADENGYFKINADKSDSLQLLMIGYLKKKIVADHDDLGSIGLIEDTKALSEVVIVGYGKPGKNRAENRAAIPVGGWDNYRKYIRANSDIPGLSGNVKIIFSIGPDGTLSSFQSKAPERITSEAILKIKKGPKWKPALKSGTAVSEQVILNFGKGD